MSLYTDCREAVMQLLADTSLAGSEVDGVFTDMDVVLLASMNHDWTENDRKLGLREANQVCGIMYRGRDLARYGPVDLTPLGHNEQDYARADSRIISAPVDGPEKLVTPNGVFKRLMVEDDPLAKQGRRVGTNRDDLRPWSAQQVSQVTAVTDTRVAQMQADLAAANQRIVELEAEVSRFRDQLSRPATLEEIRGMLVQMQKGEPLAS